MTTLLCIVTVSIWIIRKHFLYRVLDPFTFHAIDFWKSRHNRLKQMKLEDKCFRLVKGYVFCPYFSREDASKAKENVDKENQALQVKEKTELEDTS